MKKYYLHIFCFLLLAQIRLVAQDIHFSQYYFSPLSLNPANTGNSKSDFRFFGNYRSQWRDISRAYNTFSAGGDFNAYLGKHNISGGLLFVNDKSSGNLVVNKIMPSIAYHQKAGRFNLHYGVQPSIVMKSVDFNSHSFPNQLNWAKGIFDNSLPNYETNVGQRFTYFDLNAGIVISRKFGNVEPEIGAAYFHINQPKENFLGNDNSRLPLRHAYTAALEINAGASALIKLHSLYGYTDKVSDWVSGITGEYILSRDIFFTNSVFAGVMWRDGFNRNPDAGIVTVGFNYSHYTLGFSYDITFSQLKTAVDSKGAFEIAFIYRAKNTHLSQKILPCERY